MKLNKIIVAFMLVVIAFGMVACGGKANSVVGKWDIDFESVLPLMGIPLDYMDYLSEEELAIFESAKITMEFTKDGSVILSSSVFGQTETETTSYELKDDKLYIEGESCNYELEKDTLSLEIDGMVLSMTRSK